MKVLDAQLRDTAADAITDDMVLVYTHVLRDADCDYAMGAALETNAAIVLRAVANDDVAALKKIVGWVCFVTALNAEHRALTTEELAVQAAARRLSDALQECA